MERELIKFNENIEILNKDICRYEDEKGNMYIIPTGQLVCNCTYMELDKKEYEIAVFNKQVEKLDYKEEQIDRPASKYDRTKKEEDKFIIENKKVIVKKIWNVSNGLKISKSFTNKEEAIKFANEINLKVLKDIL